MGRYGAYKDSGVEWIGEIPAEWTTTKVKHSFINRDAARVPVEASERNQSADTLYPYYGASGIVDYISDYIFDEDLLLIGEDGANLRLRNLPLVYAASGKYWVNNHSHILQPNDEIDYWYAFYQLELIDLEDYLTGSTQPKLTAENLGRIPFVKPSWKEQRAIASCLDAKTAEIDALVADCEREVELLQEYRKAVISEAVTKGLDPDAPMKDSGIEWIGEIPATWRACKLRYCGMTQNGISKGGEFFGTGRPFVSYGNVYRNELDKPELFGLIESTEDERLKYGIKRGDILFTRTSETIEEVGISAGALDDIVDSCFAGFLIRFRPDESWGVSPEYAAYYFRSDLYRPYLTKEMVLVTRASMSQQLLGGLTVLIPPINEQVGIVRYLDTKTAEIDALIDTKQSMADKLREYRRSLISEAVTGKFKVLGV